MGLKDSDDDGIMTEGGGLKKTCIKDRGRGYRTVRMVEL